MEQNQDKPKLILIAGVDEVTKQFVYEAVVQIVAMSGYGVNLNPHEEPDTENTKFHILKVSEFDVPLEAHASIIFSSMREPSEVIEQENSLGLETNVKDLLLRYYHLAKWQRTMKHAHCVDYNSPINEKGLHNYANLRNLILPLNFAYQHLGMEFNKINPVKLIEALVPEFKEKSKEAKELFEQKIKENGESESLPEGANAQ